MKEKVRLTKEMMSQFGDIERIFEIIEKKESHRSSQSFCGKGGDGYFHEKLFSPHSCGCEICQAFEIVCFGKQVGEQVNEEAYKLALLIYEHKNYYDWMKNKTGGEEDDKRRHKRTDCIRLEI